MNLGLDIGGVLVEDTNVSSDCHHKGLIVVGHNDKRIGHLKDRCE